MVGVPEPLVRSCKPGALSRFSVGQQPNSVRGKGPQLTEGTLRKERRHFYGGGHEEGTHPQKKSQITDKRYSAHGLASLRVYPSVIGEGMSCPAWAILSTPRHPYAPLRTLENPRKQKLHPTISPGNVFLIVSRDLLPGWQQQCGFDARGEPCTRAAHPGLPIFFGSLFATK